MKYPFKDHRWFQKTCGMLPRAESQMCTSCRVSTDRAAPAAWSFRFYYYTQFAVKGLRRSTGAGPGESRRVQDWVSPEQSERLWRTWVAWGDKTMKRSLMYEAGNLAWFWLNRTEDLAALMWLLLQVHLLQKFPGGEAQSCNHTQVTYPTALLEWYLPWLWFLLFGICV